MLPAKQTGLPERLVAQAAGDGRPRGGPEGRARAAVPLAGAHQGRGARRPRPDRGAGHLRGQPRLAPRHPADPAARCPTSGGADRRWRPRPTTSSTPGGGRSARRCSSTPSRSTAAAARWPTTPGEVLADGWSLVIFPEGTRSKDGWMGNFRMGAAFLAHEHGVPVVPVAHRGTFAAMPRGQGWPSPGRRQLTIRFGEPLRAAPRASRCASSRRGSRPPSPRCSTRTARPGGRPAAAPPPARTPDPSGPRRRPVAPGLGAVGVAVGRRAGAAGCGPGAARPRTP